MKLHIFTGAKGGVGKTLCALSTALSQGPHRRLIVLDLNWVNPDVSAIMAGLANEPALSHSWFIYEITATDTQWLIVRPYNPYILPLLPESGARIWVYISQVLAIPEVVQFGTPDLLIVDTALHPANLIEPAPHAVSTETVNSTTQIVEEHGLQELYVWFVWTLSMLSNREAIVQTGSSMRNLSQVLEDAAATSASETSPFPIEGIQPSHEDNINLRAPQFLHVYNPKALFPVRTLVGMTWRTVKREIVGKHIVRNRSALDEAILLEKCGRLAAAPIRRSSLPIGDLYTRLQNFEGIHANHKLLYEELAEDIFINYQRSRPFNLYPIPEISKQLTGYTEAFATENTPGQMMSRNDLTARIFPFFHYVSSYLSHDVPTFPAPAAYQVNSPGN